MKLIPRLFAFGVTLLIAFSLQGCATVDPDQESDLPWNTPQQWEGAPSIPGLNGGNGF